ncbi:MAG TPA: hypothetical protein VEA80_13190 [Vitreimonas sp.]|uniref:hypothetical protein n=1 Tax=Vitreimonas sp. TaxID=3069702 RepID=UPI002D5E2231|nr:hypothetical protein [Vitreimonas sp.]HYD88424.1 hypothetical protein [Vitreimonas sp.]
MQNAGFTFAIKYAGLKALLASTAIAAVLLFAPDARAQDASELEQLRAAIAAQQQQIEAQQRAIEEQRVLIEQLMAREAERAHVAAEELDDIRAAGPRPYAYDLITLDGGDADGGQSSDEPVGEAPPPPQAQPDLAALPDFAGVLTPRGRFLLEPSLEYTNSSSNRLVFRGVEIVTGVQIGVIEASDVDRSTVVATAAGRYGLTDRLELELRVPYLYRRDRVTTLAQRDDQIVREFKLEGDDIGDIEAAIRYQLNNARRGGPIYIANLRVKSDTGTSPYEIARDEFGVLTELPTGSGFWGVEPGLTVLLPSDPVVLFANASYLYHMPEDVDRTIGDVFVGRVDPGDSIGASAGFGFALNQRFSYSLGYKHNYIFPTETELGDTTQESDEIHVGSLLFGMSYRLSDSATASLNFEFGVTEDAPDARMVFRMPFLTGGR